MKKFAASLASSAFLAATASSLSVDNRATSEQISGEQLLRAAKDNSTKDPTKDSTKEPRERAGKGKDTTLFAPTLHDVNKDFPVNSVTTTTGGLGAYYNVPWTLTTK